MSDSIFCPNCGMLKSNCVCGKYVADRTKKPYQKKEKKSKSSSSSNNKSKGAKGLYQYENRNPITVSEDLDLPVAEVYDIAEHDLPQEVIDRLKEEYPEIPEQIIENFPFEQPREGQLEIIADIEEAVDTYQRIIEEIHNASRYAKIKVYVGFEVDFFPSKLWRDDFEQIISRINADYYIGSSHVIRTADEKQIINPYDVILHGYPCPDNFIKDNYHNCWSNLIESIKSGYFAFIAHLDLHKIFKLGIEPEWNQQKMQVIETLAKYNQPYELNTSGWNKAGEQHPQDWILQELSKRDVPVIISDDAHSVDMLGQHFERAEQLLQDIGYTNRWKPNLK